MGRYVARRLLAFIPTLCGVAILVFFMTYLVPGDPAALIAGEGASQEAVQRIRTDLGLDRPWYERLVTWSIAVAHGDLGQSYFLNTSVNQAIADHLPVTASLAVAALLISIIVGVSIGIVASLNHGRFYDWLVMLVALFGLSVPAFWLALNLIVLFAVTLPWFPVGGYVAITQDVGGFIRHITLPALSLGLINAALIARMTRSSMLEVLRTDYIRTARAKGLRERMVVARHAFKNALIPIITVTGVSAGALLGGSVITETVFTLPGLGRMVIESGVKHRDFPILQGGILLIASTYLVINLIVDLLYAWVNPRIRYE